MSHYGKLKKKLSGGGWGVEGTLSFPTQDFPGFPLNFDHIN